MVLTACRADEYALEGPLLLASDAREPLSSEAERPYRMSYLTCHLIETLRQDRDYKLDWQEAFKETERRLAERLSRDGFVDEKNQPTQHPEASGPLSLSVFGLSSRRKISRSKRSSPRSSGSRERVSRSDSGKARTLRQAAS